MRTSQVWHSGWQFRKEEDTAWRDVTIPHDWSVEGPFDEHAPAGGDGGYLPCGIGHYRRAFQWEDALPESCLIRFEGVYRNAVVTLNGLEAGRHVFGYAGFELELASLLATGSNLLEVRVDNADQPYSRWYGGSGITRPVTVSFGAQARLAWNGLCIRTEDLPDGQARVRVSAETAGVNRNRSASKDRRHASVLFELLDGDAVLAGMEAPVQENGEASAEFTVAEPRRWSHAAPELYRMRATLRVDESHEIDRVLVPFGIRSIRFDRDLGFFINGQSVKLRGACLHHDGGAVGAAVPPQIWRRRLLKLREMGCNAIRMSHNPPDPALLDWCDLLGFYVMDEAFDEWGIRKEKNGCADHGYGNDWASNHVRDLSDMVLRDRNHPSIVLWSIGNEIPEQSVPEGDGIARELTALVHRLDPTRPVTSACDQLRAEPRAARDAFMNALDVVGANYINRWRLRTETMYEEERHAHPEWTLIGSEHGSAGGFRSRYELDGEEPHPWFGDYRTRIVRVAPLLRFTETRPWVAGDFMWTGIDYLGECRWPHKNASSGVLDTCGFEKDGFYFYKSVWTEAPMLHVFPHWNWQGREEKVIPVLCCTNCDTVELFLNGRSWGKKHRQFPIQGMTQTYGHHDRRLPPPTTADLHLQWDVPYEPGTLSAIGWREGVRVSEWSTATTGAPHALRAKEWRAGRLPLETEAVSLQDPRDVRQIEIEVDDAAGLLVPNAANLVRVHVTGPCRLLALDNGMPEDRTPFQTPERAALGGRLLALVERTGPGVAMVRISSDTLTTAMVELLG